MKCQCVGLAWHLQASGHGGVAVAMRQEGQVEQEARQQAAAAVAAAETGELW